MTERQSITDRLSNLPLSIIHIILSSLPTEDAVRTSILSRQWRYTWTSVHKLVFEPNVRTEGRSQELPIDFISHALSIHQGSLDKFQISCRLHESCANMDEWILRLSTKDISELMLSLYTSSVSDRNRLQIVHSSIYSCNKLTQLSLSQCELGPPPSTFKGFSFLRSLDLKWDKISMTTFESVVSNSPFLERLELVRHWGAKYDEMVRIRAPNLKYLYLVGYWTQMYLDAPLLAELRVALYPTSEQKRTFYNYGNFLGGCTNLEKLIGNDAFTRVMCIPMESWNLNSSFHRLTTLKLCLESFESEKQLRVLARLLIDSPNLQKLRIMVCALRKVAEAHFSSFGFEPNFRMEKLRIVKISTVRGRLFELDLIKFLLERSPLLEKMSVRYPKNLRAGKIRKLTNKILGCSQSSKGAEISISAEEFYFS